MNTEIVRRLLLPVVALSVGSALAAGDRGTPAVLKDADGKALGKALGDASAKSEGSVRYRWLNPVSAKVEPKISFAQNVGDDVCVVGAYDPH
jgi:hypothetical protein